MAALDRWVENPAWQPRISAARAATTAGLFTPVDVQAKVRVMTGADCRKAVEAKKIAPSSCPTGH